MTIFDSIKVSAPKVNSFDLSHEVKMTCNSGYLMPLCALPVVPGDTFQFSPQVFARLQPLVNPVMHNVDVRVEAFYVPNRIIWPNFDKFVEMSKWDTDKDPSKVKPVHPYINLKDAADQEATSLLNLIGTGSLADYLGIPVQMINGEYNDQMDAHNDLSEATSKDKFNVNALPFAAYQKIYTDYYRDANIVDDDAVFQECTDGDNVDQILKIMRLQRRMYKKDYFTSALPNAQRGNDVTIPVTGSQVDISFTGQGSTKVHNSIGQGSSAAPVVRNNFEDIPAGTTSTISKLTDDNDSQMSIDNSEQLTGSLSDFEATITNLRTAFQVQRALELSMRAGKRLKEQIYAFFGVKVPDSRLDRPEYLGGCKVPVLISEVAQTSSTVNAESGSQFEASPQGNLAGRGVAAGTFNTGKKFFPEHGWFIALISVVPKANYMQGMQRHWFMTQTMDYYWPQFQHIGEQAIQRKELFWAPTGVPWSYDKGYAPNDETFGYAPRYAEYKWIPSQVRGEFRTNLFRWTMARIFSDYPNLNKEFLDVGNNNVNRAFAVTTNDYHHFLLDVYIDLKALRPMDYFGSPM